MVGRTLFLFLILLSDYGIINQRPGDNVLTIFEDEYGHQWFGTDQGLLRKCGDVWRAYYTLTDLPGTVNEIKQPTSDISELWIGTTTGIIKVGYSSDKIKSSEVYYSSINSFKSDIINAIDFDDKNVGYFATPKGVGIFANAVWKFYTRFIDIVKNEFTSVKAKGDTIYFGTNGEGVARIIKNSDGYSGASTYITPWSDLTSDSITCIYIDSKGNQWYGTTKGISKHSNTDAKDGWDFSITNQLPNQFVTAIVEDLSDNIWIGTLGGLVKLNVKSCEVYIWTMDNGLPSNVINDIFISKDQSVWIGTDFGASHFNGFSFVNIRTSDYAKNYTSF
jgi:ligand-binding sensor domain-containing protein